MKTFDSTAMSLSLHIIPLSIILIKYVYSFPEIHCGDPTIRSDTIAAIDGCAYFSFTVTPNITDIWYSTCGSEFDTYQYVLNATGHIIAENDDSDECGRQSVLHLSQPKLTPGKYTLNLTGWAGHTGKYTLNMYCNDFNISLYPALKQCNNVFGDPVDVCLPWDGHSTKYTCDENGDPWQTNYYSTNCTGNIRNHTSARNAKTYTCDAARNCDVISLITLFTHDGDGCFDFNLTHEFKHVNILNLCIPGGIKIFCTDESISIQFYKDEYCNDLSHITNYTLGCNEFPNSSVEITNLSCPTTFRDVEGEAKQIYVVIIGITGGVLLICVLFLFGCYRYKQSRTINYRSRMKVHKQYLLDDTEMSVNSTYSDEGRSRAITEYLS